AKGKAQDKELTVLSWILIEKQQLLLGTTDGLYLLSIGGANTHSCRKIEIKTNLPSSLFDRIYSIIHYQDEKYFLATKGGVVLYDAKKQSFTPFVHDPKNPTKTIRFGLCRLAYKDAYGKLWFGTSSGG